MSLVFGAITPHPAMMLPTIGRDQSIQLEKTRKAFEKLEQDLYLQKPEILIVISPHEGLFEEAFVVNAHTEFHSDFSDFGDLVTKQTWKGATDFAAKIAHESSMSDIPVRLVSEQALSHGSSIPLLKLTEHLPDIKILPIGFSAQSPKDHVRFGEMLKENIMQHSKRIAVVASGNLSHCLTKNSPTEYNELGASFDEKLLELLQTRNTSGIMNLDPAMIEAAEECGYRSILILLGMLREMDYSFESLSYEYPFGVGYLVGQFHL